MRSPRAGAAIGVLALVLGTATVAACGTNGDTSGVVATDRASVDPDTGDITVDTDAGQLTTGTDLPEGFPIKDVPLIDEQVVSGVRGGAVSSFGWSVVMQSSRSVDDLTDEVEKDYAGWDTNAGSGSSMGDLSVLNFEKGAYEVGVTVARSGSRVAITYVVKKG